MITVQQTIELIKQNQPAPRVISVKLMQSRGMILAQEIIATIASPPYSNSAMDGFAVHWQDVQSTTPDHPVQLNIIGESSAGYPFNGLFKRGQAIRISTGAIVPDDVDTVVPIEQCSVEQKTVKIIRVNKKHQHIRFTGTEFKKGEKLLDAGIKIGSAQIALIASLGITDIKVYRSPQVIIMTTGSELVPFDKKAEPYQLWDSNTPMLISAVHEAGGEIKKNIHVKDDPELTLQTIEKASGQADIIISSGGVSMGEHDHVRDMALKAGFQELFWKVKQKPGKPMFLAKKDQTLLVALPGNPVSAYICFKHYIRPLLQSIRGESFNWPTIQALAQQDIINNLNRTHLMRVKLLSSAGTKIFEAINRQGSNMSSSIARADGYIILGEGAQIKKDDEVTVYLF